MTDRVVRKLNFARKLLLWTAACLALALPVVFGLLKVTPAHASGSALDQFAGSWQSQYEGRTFFTLNMAVKDGLLTGTAVHSTRITAQNGELVPDSDDNATDKILEAHASDRKLLLKIEDPEDPSEPMPLELRLTAQNEAEGRLVTDGQSGAPQQSKPWHFVRVSDVESQGSAPHFSSVSIRPHPAENQGFVTGKIKMMMAPLKDGGDFTVRGVSLHSLIRGAYKVQETQIIGEPDWARTERYDIDAKLDPSFAEQTRKLSDAEDRLMALQLMQQFLADYFKVSLHQEMRDQPVYELLVNQGGPKLQLSPESKKMGMMRMGMGELNSEGTPLDLLVAQLSQRLGRTVVDKTGLKGNYVFNLHWTPDADEQARVRAVAPGLSDAVEKPGASGPSLMTAIEEQLGLKLQPTTERVPILVIDHAEQPAQN